MLKKDGLKTASDSDGAETVVGLDGMWLLTSVLWPVPHTLGHHDGAPDCCMTAAAPQSRSRT